MKRNILAENMRRFGTKNLQEQSQKLDLETFNIGIDVSDEFVGGDSSVRGDTINVKTTEKKRIGYFEQDLDIRIQKNGLNIESVELTSTPNDKSKVPSITFRNSSNGAKISLPVATLTLGTEKVDDKIPFNLPTTLSIKANGEIFKISLDLSSLYLD